MQNDSLYDSLLLVERMQSSIDAYYSNLNNIRLNLTCDSFQSAVISPRDHPFFEKTLSFFSFLHKKHPEILEEWRKTNNETK